MEVVMPKITSNPIPEATATKAKANGKAQAPKVEKAAKPEAVPALAKAVAASSKVAASAMLQASKKDSNTKAIQAIADTLNGGIAEGFGIDPSALEEGLWNARQAAKKVREVRGSRCLSW